MTRATILLSSSSNIHWGLAEFVTRKNMKDSLKLFFEREINLKSKQHTHNNGAVRSYVVVMFPNRNIRAYGGCLGSNKR